jgi:hypothetical protein
MAPDIAQPKGSSPVQKPDQPKNSSAALCRVGPVINPGIAYARRVKVLRAIKTGLSEREIDLIYQYLQIPSANPEDRAAENWLRNEIMDKLVRQKTLPGGLSDLLVGIYQDHHQDAVMRDYAVQHMAAVYGRLDPAEKVSVQQALSQAAGETDSSIAGTALLAMLRMTKPTAGSLPSTSQAPRTMDRKHLADTALKLAADNNCGALSRITAVQVCGMLKVDGAFPVIEELAQGSPSMPLRVAATAALGDLGKAEAAPILEQFITSADPQQALAARSAMVRLAKQTRL